MDGLISVLADSWLVVRVVVAVADLRDLRSPWVVNKSKPLVIALVVDFSLPSISPLEWL